MLNKLILSVLHQHPSLQLAQYQLFLFLCSFLLMAWEKSRGLPNALHLTWEFQKLLASVGVIQLMKDLLCLTPSLYL